MDMDTRTSSGRQHVVRVVVSPVQLPETHQHAAMEGGSQSNASAWRTAWWATKQQPLVVLIPLLLLAGGWVWMNRMMDPKTNDGD